MSGALVPPPGDAVAAALRRVSGPAEAVREWVPLPAAPEGWTWREGELVPVPPAPCPRLLAAVARASGAVALAAQPWQPLPAAPEGWSWRAGALERVSGARRWTIGRRAAWDARWQMLLWRDGRAYLVRQGEAEHVAEWAALVVVAEVFEVVGEGWRKVLREFGSGGKILRGAQSEAPAG